MTVVETRPPSIARAIAEALAPRRRVALDEVWRTFLAIAPELATSPDRRRELAACLEELADLGLAELPTGRRAYDRSEQPPLPRTLRLRNEPAPPPPSRRAAADLRRYPWLPQLSFVTDLKRVRPDELQLLERINAFLRDGGTERPRVPWQERSLELFADEKHLERFLRGRLFEPDRLSLETLRVSFAPPPIAFRKLNDAPTALVVENSASFHTLANLLPRSSGTIGLLVYGDGFTFIHSVASLRDAGRLERLLYFGDIDPAGLQIPVEAAKIARRFAQLPEVVPADPLYRLLLRHGQPSPSKQTCAPSRATALAAWLANDLRADVARLMRERWRLAQEAVGYDVLSRELRMLGSL